MPALPPPSFARRLARLLLALTLALAMAWPATADEPRPFDLEAARATLSDIEQALRNKDLSDADLQRLRVENDPLGVALQAAIADLTPRLAASTKRLAELTPKSKEVAPASDPAAVELASEKQKHDELDANLRAARAMLLKVDDNAARIGAARREHFARETFARSASVLNPQLWLSVWREAPGDAAALTARVGEWLAGVEARMTRDQALGLLAVALAMALAAAPLRWIARRVIYRDPQAGAPSRLKRTLAAAWAILVLAVLPLLGLWILVLALDAFDLSEPRMQGLIDAVLDSAQTLIVFNALGRGLLAPRLQPWRLIPVGDRAAATMFRTGMIVAVIWAAERLVEPAADAIASLNIAVAGRAIGLALIALTLARALRRLAAPISSLAGAAQGDGWAPARTLGWTLVAALTAAALGGYIAFGAFLVNQAILLTILACGLYLVDVVVREGTETLLRPDAPIGRRLMSMVGLRRNALAQIVVIVQGLERMAVLLVAIVAVLEPWGVQSQDMFGALRAAYFGFTVGGVTLSLSSMIAAAAVFAFVVFATRIVQRWLGARLLPTTRLDAGVSNSIRTIFGYVGFIIAALMGGAELGLDFQKLAFVAGALSVGIGFGLQGIANNFVSGLILLWERGIRVGDWVTVGAEQGFVRRINARATEIETFDRGTLIVPNANLVGGVVKNWVHADRVGRIIVPLNVGFESDVEQVREILIAAARAQDMVLSIPAPTVAFAEFADWAFKLQLICFVDDIELGERIKSELNFDILRRLREANIPIPYPRYEPPRKV